MNWRIATNCKAGICFTPSLEAIQVVPQMILTQKSAKNGNPIVLIWFKKAFFIRVLTL